MALSLIPLGLEPMTSQPVTARPQFVERVRVQAMTSWNALIIGIVTGFAMAAGTLVFNKLATRMRWK